jgi:hypothetical protein
MPVTEGGADDGGDAYDDCGYRKGLKRQLPEAGRVTNGKAGTS